MENMVWLRVVGKGGLIKGTIIEDAFTFEQLDKMQYPELVIMSKINTMREQLEGYEKNYSPEQKKDLGIK